LVAGDISVRTEWMALCNEAGLTNVHFLGQLDHQDMPAFMVSLDLLVIPSYTETLPTTLLEALASGTPVMATAVGGVTEFLRSKWGITLPSPEMDLIVDAVNYWRKHRTELEQMGRDGQRYVREHHSWERASALTEGVYQSCLETQ
jgi:glycosyltransferase involved in cell wall biosynthesis